MSPPKRAPSELEILSDSSLAERITNCERLMVSRRKMAGCGVREIRDYYAGHSPLCTDRKFFLYRLRKLEDVFDDGELDGFKVGFAVEPEDQAVVFSLRFLPLDRRRPSLWLDLREIREAARNGGSGSTRGPP